MDIKAIEKHIRGLLVAIGEDPDREGLRETPARVARTFEVPSDPNSGDTVVIKDISVFSYCEHHLALMYDMKVDVAYVPHGRVLGLSKIARICDMAAKRLQLQERLGRDIAEIISLAALSPDVGIRIEGCHSCMTSRGIKNTVRRKFPPFRFTTVRPTVKNLTRRKKLPTFTALF